MPQLQCGVVESTLVLKVVSPKGHARRLGRVRSRHRGSPGWGMPLRLKTGNLCFSLGRRDGIIEGWNPHWPDGVDESDASIEAMSRRRPYRNTQ
jgi:hypothetical protein